MTFLDTSCLLCLADASELCHSVAIAAARPIKKAITQSYVLAEFIALASSRRFNRKLALQFLEGIHQDPKIEIVYVDKSLHFAAIDLLQRRLDKEWSLCDAVSFVLMERLGIT